MKKKEFVNSTLLAGFFVLLLFIFGRFQPGWLGEISYIILPGTAGVLTVLIQKKYRSYEYLPAVLWGGAVFSLLSLAGLVVMAYTSSQTGQSFFQFLRNFLSPEMWPFLALWFLYFLGGLVGLVIRGVNELFLPKQQIDLSRLSRRVYIISALIFLMLLSGGLYFLSHLPQHMWFCQDGEWAADGSPTYKKPDVACIGNDSGPFVWHDGPSKLEIAYPSSWRPEVKISHEELPGRRRINFTYSGLTDQLLFAVSIWPASTSPMKLFTLSNERRILLNDKYIITLAEGGYQTTMGGYSRIYSEVDEVVAKIGFSDDSGEVVASGPEIWWPYRDEKYRFNFQYPSNLRLTISDDEVITYSEKMGGKEMKIDRNINCSVPFTGPYLVSLNIIEEPEVVDLDEWLAAVNERLSHYYEDQPGRFYHKTLEKEITLDGWLPAYVTYSESDMESYPYEKEIAWFWDGNLFTLNARGLDFEKLWNSLAFYN